jgi:hypothetical protein
MVFPRTNAVIVALCSAVLLAACGNAETPSGSASAGPTTTPTQAAAVTWADGVCSASTDLRDSVRAGESLQFDPSSSSTSLDQAKAQVRDRVTTVQQSAAALASALSAVPPGADPALTAAQQQLQTAAGRAQAATEQLGAAADQVAAADTATEVAAGLVALKAALTGTANDLATYLESLRATVTSGEDALRSAFGGAPACQELAASPSATASP